MKSKPSGGRKRKTGDPGSPVGLSVFNPVSVMSHELRTPLSVLEHLASILLEKEMTNPARREILITIRDEAGRLSSLVNRVIDLKRIDSGDWQLDKVEVNLAREVDHVLLSLDLESEGRGVTVRKSGDTRLHADRVLLEALLREALVNALRFSAEGSTICVETNHLGNGSVALRVDSAGVALPPEAIPAVFEVFVRAVLPEHRERAGAGLGLSFVQAIARAHGGSASMTAMSRGNRLDVFFPTVGKSKTTRGGMKTP